MQLFVLDTLVRHAARIRWIRKRHTCRLRLESSRSTGEPVPICRGITAIFPVSLVPEMLVEWIIGSGQWRGNAWRGCQPETRDQPSCRTRARAHRERFREPIECRARRQGWPSTSSTCCTLNSHPKSLRTGERSSLTKHAQCARRVGWSFSITIYGLRRWTTILGNRSSLFFTISYGLSTISYYLSLKS